MEKVLIIVGDAAETVGTLHPFYRLQEGGYQPVVAAPEKRKYQIVMQGARPSCGGAQQRTVDRGGWRANVRWIAERESDRSEAS